MFANNEKENNQKKNVYKCLPDGAAKEKKKKVSVFDEGTAAKLSALLDLS